MPKRKPKQAVLPRFKVGNNVRVRHGVMDVNYPDIPLGGWAGKIAEVHEDGMYTVRWSRETLTNIHPVYKNRCEIDGYDIEEYWLRDDDLEPDAGGPLAIEPPTRIEAKPLSPKDQDDRIRMVFGLTSNDPLPDVDDDTLQTYQRHLAANLALPFEAEHTPEKGPMFRRSTSVKVTGLGDPDGEPPYIDDMYGLLCDARIGNRTTVLPLGELEVPKGKPNRRLVADYCYWFWNNR